MKKLLLLLCFPLIGFGQFTSPSVISSSRYELVEMHQNIGQGNTLGLGNIGGFSNSYYWSSSEASSSSKACIKYFGSTTSGVNYFDKDELEYVRAVRAF